MDSSNQTPITSSDFASHVTDLQPIAEHLNKECSESFTAIEKVRSWAINPEVPRTPKILAEGRMRLNGQCLFLADKELQLIKLRADWWERNRPDYKSDASAERAWERTPAGLLQIKIHTTIKLATTLQASIKQMHEVLQNEMFNNQ